MENYLRGKGVDEFDIRLRVLWFFSPIVPREVDYDECFYRLLKEGLTHISEAERDEIIRLHTKALVELIETAEKLRSGIRCRD